MLIASFARLDQYIRDSETAPDVATDLYPRELSPLIEHLLTNGGPEGKERLRLTLQAWEARLTRTVDSFSGRSEETLSADDKRMLGRALFFLGMFEKEGFGRAAAPERAAPYFERAGQILGFTPALVQLALIKFYIHKDIEAGIALLERAIAQGNARAMSRRGEIHLNGWFGQPKAPTLGMVLLQRAADLNQYEAIAKLADILKSKFADILKSRGMGEVKSDEAQLSPSEMPQFTQFLALYLRSAELGCASATLFLGERALEAMDQGHPAAMLGGVVDLEQLIRLTKDAAIRGEPDALGCFAYLASITQQEVPKEEVIQVSEYAIALNSSYGMLARAILILEPYDGPVDHARAFWLLNRAIMQDEANQDNTSLFFKWFHRYYNTSGRMTDQDRSNLLNLMWQDFLDNKPVFLYIVALLSSPVTQALIADKLIREADLSTLNKILTSEDHLLNKLLRPINRIRGAGEAIDQFARVQTVYAERKAHATQVLYLVDGEKFAERAAISRSLQAQPHYDRNVWGEVGSFLFARSTASALKEKLKQVSVPPAAAAEAGPARPN